MKQRSLLTLLSVFLAAMLLMAACSSAEPTPTVAPQPTAVPTEEEPMEEEPMEDEAMEEEMAEPTIVDLAVSDGNFTTLVAALEAAGLVETLQGEGPFTVFAPTDEAFAALGEETIAGLLADTETLSQILLYHVVSGEVLAADVVELESATTVNGEDVAISVEGESVMVNESNVITTDLQGSNGVIHVIDAVLMPPSMVEAEEMAPSIAEIAASDENFSTLLAAVEAAGLTETLAGEGTFTVFAPTNEAFAALGEDAISALLADPEALSGILLYHVAPVVLTAEDVVASESIGTVQGEEIAVAVEGDAVMLNGTAQVTATDIKASNGIVHVIDAVILPPSVSEAAAAELPNIVETAVAAGTFQTLVAAVEAAGLAETLQGEGPFTVFAPTDDAFAALGEETINALLADPETLSGILLYHVVAGEVRAEDVVTLNSAETAAGFPVVIRVSDEGVFVNNAMVTATDIEASNGIIHVLDTVILPPAGDIVETAIADGRFTTLVAALEAAGLVEALQAEGPFTVFAPTDDAFAALGEETINALLADPETLSNILLYHVVDGAVFSGDVAGLTSATTLNGTDVTISVDEDGNVFINDAQVIITDIITKNGVIHVIDTVIVPAE